MNDSILFKGIVGAIFLLVISIVVLGIYQEAMNPSSTYIVAPDGSTITEIEVDGHKYLKSSQGGMVHAESCSCKSR